MRRFLKSTRQSFVHLQRQLRQRYSRTQRSRTIVGRRRLFGETLETRRLLAADFEGFRHNAFDAEDVNDDGQVSLVDALLVINSMEHQDRGDSEMFTDVNNDGKRSVLDALRIINRLNRGRETDDRNPPPGDRDVSDVPSLPDEIRSIDGTGNNLENPSFGTPGEALLRIADADYGDGVSTPAGADRPSTREISNELADVGIDELKNDRDLSAFLYVWGQFIDHDLGLSESSAENEAFDIAVPSGDPWFDPFARGDVVIPLTRSSVADGTGTSVDNPAQQINEITSYIDGSQVYGSDQATADSLRTFEGGRLAITDEGLIPMDEHGMVIAGDVRASENVALTAIQTLFVREHNRLADQIAAADPDASDEQIYQQARAMVIAEIQSITYNEFLPALLGKRGLQAYDGYDPTVNPGIANEFSTAAFRFGHSTLNDDIEFFDNDGRAIGDEVELKDAFFNASLLEETGIDSILKYDASSQSQEIDLAVVDSLRNFLFGPPGAGGLDLVAMNIQRGRDHGLADYNSTRAAYGLDPVESFSDITSDIDLQGKLASLYGDVDNIDLWVGLMAEDHLRDASVGELTATIIADQFQRTRDGDRFYYENVYSGSELRSINQTTLADVIERNTDVEGLQENVFFMRAEVRGQVTAGTTLAAVSLSRQGKNDRPDSPGVADVTVELLNDEGEVIDSTVTDSRGNYRFRSFPETGDYQIRVAQTGETLSVLISDGDTRIREMDFEMIV
ncbi:dockerin type I domain-containing protein [Stieleria sp. TO1_6]|uniref:peroxidase family protein n=1 Tax=Stieleria tagensis TaxID=2956795 RepID=UPI00209B802B|nr:peroxidase family protein [Stieleria tagensis]MCO8123065.1 dockerin type I domain-containing protein [Stieleria tagensis]